MKQLIKLETIRGKSPSYALSIYTACSPSQYHETLPFKITICVKLLNPDLKTDCLMTFGFIMANQGMLLMLLFSFNKPFKRFTLNLAPASKYEVPMSETITIMKCTPKSIKFCPVLYGQTGKKHARVI